MKFIKIKQYGAPYFIILNLEQIVQIDNIGDRYRIRTSDSDSIRIDVDEPDYKRVLQAIEPYIVD